ncbi:MAG: M1 family metallopeptidase [Anaerolineae bacterium]|jgi:hypothetical protein
MRHRRRAIVELVLLLLLGAVLSGCAALTPSRVQLVTATPGELPPPRPTVSVRPSPVALLPTPRPTPTPVPLPDTCLLPRFAADVILCRDAPHYDLELTVDPDASRVTGSESLRYANAEGRPLNDLYLRLLPNSPTYGGTMTVSHVLLNGQPISPSFELERSAMRIPLDPPLPAGESLTLTMDFGIQVPTTARVGHGLFSNVVGVMALPNAYPLVPVYDDEGWNAEIAPVYADDVYADVALYTVDVTAPADVMPVASGTCDSIEPGRWLCDAAPMREFTLILGRDFEWINREVDRVVVNSYYYPRHPVGGQRALEVAADALTAFTEMFGPYPYSELDVVETPNYLGGMEYPGLVVVADTHYASMAGLEWLVAHEVAHQWWFAVVGNDQIDEPWLDEALTQYSTMLYYESVYGPERADGILRSVFVGTQQMLMRRGQNQPIGLPAAEYERALYWQIVYDKGALYFHELRQAVGDEAFFEILRTYYERNRYGIATPASLLAAVESVTGEQYLDLYQEWVLGEG